LARGSPGDLADRSVHWLLGKRTVFADASGKPVCITGVNLDVPQAKRSAAALRESEERFRIIADTAPVMIWVSGTDKLCTFFNKRWLFSPDAHWRRNSARAGPSASIGMTGPMPCNLFIVFDARATFQIKYRLRRTDGEYRWLLDNGVPRFEPTVPSPDL
jgi:PAS domain-containing protein